MMVEEKVIDLQDAKQKKNTGAPDGDKGKFADQTVENTTIDGMAVRTYTLNDSNDSLYRVLSEEEIAKREAEYERKGMEEAERRFREKERMMNAQISGEMDDSGFGFDADAAEGAADRVRLDPEKLQDALAKIRKDDRIVCIGDSIVYGYEVEGTLTWIGRLRRECEINLLNVGLNGDTTEGMFNRFHEHVVDIQAKAVVILGGGNDLIGGTPLEYVTNNFAMMCQMALNYGIVPIVGIAPEPDHKKVPEEWKMMIDYEANIRNLTLYKEWLLAFAEANQMPVIDFDTGMKSQLRAGYSRYFMDGAHPNPAGHKIMAGIAKKAFQDMGILPEEKPPADDRFAL